jgi:shikimate kinase
VHLYLIGYRGSGKTTVGKTLAGNLGWGFLDTDQMIELSAGRSITDIFADDGEQAFRELESIAIDQAAALDRPTVVSLGGGAVLREQNRLRLAATGRCVWLRAPAELLYERITNDALSARRRPQLSVHGGYAEVVDLLAFREPIYEQLADKQVMIADRTPDQIVAEIVEWIKSTFSPHATQ